jgi:hypothetical protein
VEADGPAKAVVSVSNTELMGNRDYPWAAANSTAEKQLRWLSGRIALRSGSPLRERRRGWAIEDDSARNHRNTLLWTICPLQQDSVAKHASQSSRPSLLRRSPAALAHSENASAPSSDERRDHEFTAEAS